MGRIELFVILIMFTAAGLAVGMVFEASFDGFCSNPTGAGNWIVTPFCR